MNRHANDSAWRFMQCTVRSSLIGSYDFSRIMMIVEKERRRFVADDPTVSAMTRFPTNWDH